MFHNIVFYFFVVLDLYNTYPLDYLWGILEKEKKLDSFCGCSLSLNLGKQICVGKRSTTVKLLEIYSRFYKYLFLVMRSLHTSL